MKPTKGIMCTKEFSDAHFFTVACECGDNTHDLDFFIEIDRKMKQVTVQTSTTEHTDYWSEVVRAHDWMQNVPEPLYNVLYPVVGLINSVVRKVKLTAQIWFTGTVTYQSTTIMSAETAKNYANTILTSIQEMEQQNDASK